MGAFETFADKDFSHRRLAHRGSYGRAACGPWASTVRRMLNDHDLRYRAPAPAVGFQAPSPP